MSYVRVIGAALMFFFAGASAFLLTPIRAAAGDYIFIRSVGSTGSGNAQFQSPNGIAVDSSGNVWVADSDNNRIQEFTSTTALSSYR